MEQNQYIAEALDFLGNELNSGSDYSDDEIANMILSHLKDNGVKISKKDIKNYLKKYWS